jgi:uncharacterized protein YggE
MKNALFCFLVLTSSIILHAQVLQNIPLVTVTGEGVAKAVPDQAIISVRVQQRIDITNLSLGSEAFLFSKENTDIKFFGDDNHEIFSTIPEIDVKDNKNAAVFIKEFIITVRDISLLTKVITELIRRDFTNIYSITYRLSDVTSAKNSARLMAVANARAAAELYGKALGQSIGKAHMVEEEDAKIVNWYTEKYRNPGEVVNTVYNYNPGYISVPCRVTVSFELN